MFTVPPELVESEKVPLHLDSFFEETFVESDAAIGFSLELIELLRLLIKDPKFDSELQSKKNMLHWRVPEEDALIKQTLLRIVHIPALCATTCELSDQIQIWKIFNGVEETLALFWSVG